MAYNIWQRILAFTCILLSVQILPTKTITTEEADTLEMVHVLYRHGDRAPLSFYPKDPLKDKASKVWPEGLGQLTKIGKAMEYKLGMWLRNRYKTFIKKVFDSEEINILSTDFDRTLMSAQCVLASFYYPDNETRFIHGLPWMPTPIHTAASGDDKILNLDAACPRMSTEIAKLQYIPEIKHFYEKHKDLFARLSVESGLKLTTALEVDFLFDTLKIEKIYNQSIPRWAKDDYAAMQEVSDFSFKMNTYTQELKRLRGGPLLGILVENMRKKSHDELPLRKMLMFSAHDTTISILLNSMGVFNNISPPYAATVLVELHQKNSQHFVKVFYQNDSTMGKPPRQLALPGCSLDCPLDQWTDLLSDVTPKDWNKECYRPDPIMDHYFIVGLTGAVIILVGFLIAGGIYCYRRKYLGRPVSYQYETLADDDA